MNITNLIEKRLREKLRRGALDGDVNAVVAANVGERGTVTTASSTARATSADVPQRQPPDRA